LHLDSICPRIARGVPAITCLDGPILHHLPHIPHGRAFKSVSVIVAPAPSLAGAGELHHRACHLWAVDVAAECCTRGWVGAVDPVRLNTFYRHVHAPAVAGSHLQSVATKIISDAPDNTIERAVGLQHVPGCRTFYAELAGGFYSSLTLFFVKEKRELARDKVKKHGHPKKFKA